MIATTPAKKEKATITNETLFASKIPYSHLIDAETIETKSGHLLQTIKLHGLTADTLDDELIDHEKFIRNTLLMSIADSSTSLYFHTIRKRKVEKLNGIPPQAFAYDLQQKWQGEFSQLPSLVNEHYVTVVKKPPVGKIRRLSDILRSLSNKVDEKARAIYRRKMHDDLNKITQRLLMTLSHYGAKKLSTVHCTKTGKTISELLSFLSHLINLSDREILPPCADIAHILPYKRAFFDVRNGVLALRDSHHQSIFASLLWIKDYARITHAGCVDSLLHLPTEMIITQSFSFLDEQHARGKIQEQARNQAQSDVGETTENLKIHDTLDELGSGTAVTGEHHLSILCQGKTQQALAEAISLIDATLNQLGMIALREDKGMKAAFFAQFPGNHAYVVRRAVITSENMVSLASLHNDNKGQAQGNHWGEAVTVLETASGAPYYFNFHVLDVANTMLIGPQGSGKTLLESFLLALSMKYGGRLILFDMDESLKTFVLAMEGHYINLSAGKRTGFAPFQMDDTPENRHFLMNLLRMMATVNGQTLSDEDELRLKAAVDGAYQLPQEKRILRNLMPHLGMKKVGSLRMRYEAWVNDGDYAWVFDNELDSLSLDVAVMGFDMTSILTDGIARGPLYYYLFHRLDQLLDGTRTRIVVVEGWRALQDQMMLNKIKEWSSTPRKKEGFLILDTQSPDDIAQSPIGCKLIQESVTQIYFANPKGNYDDYVTRFGLTEKEFTIIKHLDIASRFFLLKQGKDSVVVRLNLKGFEDEINILSWRLKNNKYVNVDALLKEHGAHPKNWLPLFYQKMKTLAVETQ